MNKDQYKHYIKTKYSQESKIGIANPNEIGYFYRIDAMLDFYELIKDEHTILKGALSLLKQNYRRPQITRDADISLKNISTNDFANKLLLENLENDVYSYKAVETEEIMQNSHYKGTKITISYIVKGTVVNDKFSVDLSVEDLWEQMLEEEVYSIERTLADKFTSMIYFNIGNGRDKDFVDFNHLYAKIDTEKFKSYLIPLSSRRKIRADEIISFEENLDEILREHNSMELKANYLQALYMLKEEYNLFVK